MPKWIRPATNEIKHHFYKTSKTIFDQTLWCHSEYNSQSLHNCLSIDCIGRSDLSFHWCCSYCERFALVEALSCGDPLSCLPLIFYRILLYSVLRGQLGLMFQWNASSSCWDYLHCLKDKKTDVETTLNTCEIA